MANLPVVVRCRGELESLIGDGGAVLQQQFHRIDVAGNYGGEECVLAVRSDGVYVPACIQQLRVECDGWLQVTLHFGRDLHAPLQGFDTRYVALHVNHFVDAAIIAVGQAKDQRVSDDASWVDPGNREEVRLVEGLHHLTKALLRHRVVLLAGNGAATQPFEVDVTALAEIDAETWTAKAECTLLGIRESDVFEVWTFPATSKRETEDESQR